MNRSPRILFALSVVAAVAVEGDAHACRESQEYADLVIESVTVGGVAVSPAESRIRARLAVTSFSSEPYTLHFSADYDREGFREE
jgi:hypothetical protein